MLPRIRTLEGHEASIEGFLRDPSKHLSRPLMGQHLQNPKLGLDVRVLPERGHGLP